MIVSKFQTRLFTLRTLFIALSLFGFLGGCYSFREGSIADSVKTVRVPQITNVAPYRNPQLAPLLSDRVRQKIINQTRLSITNGEGYQWEILAEIRDYSVTTAGVTNNNGRSESSVNRLNITVHVTINDVTSPEAKPREYDITRQFDFPANQSLQQAENRLLDEMVRNVGDEIFNRLFSNW